jgi:outer membrane protein
LVVQWTITRKKRSRASCKRNRGAKPLKIFNLIIIFLIFYTGTFSQDTLTIDASLKIALENNFGIKIARNQITQAENNTSILNKNLLPTVSLGASSDYNLGENQFTYNVERNDLFSEDAVVSSSSARAANIQVSYTLFDGFQTYYNNKKLDLQFDLSEIDARRIIENTLLEVYQNYYTLVLLQSNLTNQEDQLGISRDRFSRIKFQKEYGNVNSLDLLNAEIDLNNDSIVFIDMKSQFKNAQKQLNLILGRDPYISFNVEDEFEIFGLSLEKIKENSEEFNVDIASGQSNLSLQDYAARGSNLTWLPKLNLSGGYNYRFTNNDESNLIATQRSSGVNANVTLSWSLFDGGQRTVIHQNNEINILNAQLQLDEITFSIDNQISQAWSDYNNYLNILEMEKKNVKANELNFSISKNKYKQGQITSLDYRTAQLNLLKAKQNMTNAKVNAKISETLLLKLSGQLDKVRIE